MPEWQQEQLPGQEALCRTAPLHFRISHKHFRQAHHSGVRTPCEIPTAASPGRSRQVLGDKAHSPPPCTPLARGHRVDCHLPAPPPPTDSEPSPSRICTHTPFRHFLFLHGLWSTWGTSCPRPVAVCLGSEPSLRRVGSPAPEMPSLSPLTSRNIQPQALPSLPVSGPESRLLLATWRGAVCREWPPPAS